MSELLDLVDEQDQVIGQMERDEVYAKGMRNIRFVNAFVVNSEGKLWIPKRTAHKRIFPNALDISVGGHVDAGEDYETAFKREATEELNIDFNKTTYKEVGYFTPKQHGVFGFQKVYEIYLDTAPNYNPDDFSEAFWYAPEEVLAVIQSGTPAKSDLPVLIKLLYS